MAAVEQLYVQPKSEARALKRIRLLSLPFQVVFAGIALLQLGMLLLLATFFALSDGQAVRVHPGGGELSTDPSKWGVDSAWPPGSIAVGDLPLASQIYGLGVLFLIVGCQVAAFYSLSRLFGAYRRGVDFAGSTMAWMRRAGAFLLATAVVPAVLQPITQALGLLDSNWFNQRSITALVVGGALFVLAYVIELGREIETDSKGYI